VYSRGDPLRSPFSGFTRACPFVVRKEYWRALVRSWHNASEEA